MGYPYPNSCLCAFLGPYLEPLRLFLFFWFPGSGLRAWRVFLGSSVVQVGGLGISGLGLRLGLEACWSTWRFMASYKWGL